METQAPRQSTRVRTVPEKESNEPNTYNDVLKSSESELWLKAMESEMDSMYKSSLELDKSWYICFVETIKEFDF